MTPAISFALISLAAAGCLDVTFKRFSLKERSRGMYVFGCGTVWLKLQLIYFLMNDVHVEFDQATIIYGVITGTVLVLANILLIESLTGLDVGLGSMIYRLNTIGVVLISFFILSEDLSFLKVAGIVIGIVSVSLLYERSDPENDVISTPLLLLILAVIASVFRALYGVGTKFALEDGANAEGMLLIAATSWIVFGLLYAALREQRVRLTGKKVAYSLISGTLGFIVVNALIAALKIGEASVVVPVANLSFAVALMISFGLGMESLGHRKFLAVGFAAISVFLLAQTG